METYNNILVVCQASRYCTKVFKTGVSLARKFDARLHVLHVIHDPFSIIPAPYQDEEYKTLAEKARVELDRMVKAEKAEGLVANEWVRDGNPVDIIFNAVEEASIDLILMLSRKEGRVEHHLFGKTNEAIIRKLPASIMLVAA